MSKKKRTPGRGKTRPRPETAFDPIPTPEQHIRNRTKAFALADKYAEQALFATVTGIETAVPDSGDALDRLARQSTYFNQEEFDAAGGNTICACYDAGLMLGLAFGLRLRGVR